jgi:hypothetical protein
MGRQARAAALISHHRNIPRNAAHPAKTQLSLDLIKRRSIHFRAREMLQMPIITAHFRAREIHKNDFGHLISQVRSSRGHDSTAISCSRQRRWGATVKISQHLIASFSS